MRWAAALVIATAAFAFSEPASASCIGNTTQQVVPPLGAVPQNALVVAAPLESDVAPLSNRGDELALRVASLVAGKIAGAHVQTRTASLDQARAMAARAAVLVYVRVQLQKGQLRVTVDEYPVVHNVWDRARLPPPPPTAHAYAAAPIDAEVRAFFPSLPLELQTVHKATHVEGEVLAAACGDVDGDGGAELLLVSRDRVALGRLRAGKMQVERSVAWSALAKRAPVPLREPLGGAEIALEGVRVGTSDRGGVILDESLGAPRVTSGIPIGAGVCASIAPLRSAFEGSVSACEPATATAAGTARESFDTASAFELVAPSGERHMAIATRESGKLKLRVGGVEKGSFDGAGAQVAVLDANLDGVPELAFTNEGPDDVITIVTWKDGVASVVNRIAAPAGVRALAACPSIDGGSGALVAVVGSEVWLVR